MILIYACHDARYKTDGYVASCGYVSPQVALERLVIRRRFPRGATSRAPLKRNTRAGYLSPRYTPVSSARNVIISILVSN